MALLPLMGALAACSNDDVQTADRVPITLTGTTLTIEETRAAAASNLNDGYIESGQTVKVLIRNTESTGPWAEYAYVAAANGVLTPPSTPPYYPLDNTPVNIVAYSPSTASSTFSVLPDQTTNDSYMASDLVYASATNKAKSTTAVPLQFEHKMAKIVVNVTAGSGVSEIQSVRLASVYPQVPFDPSTGVIGSATGSQTSITIVNNNTTATASGAAVIPGQTVVGDLLTVVTDLGTATYAVESKTFTAGKVYSLNINVGRTAIGTTTAITGWTDTEGVVIRTGDDNVKIFRIEHPTAPGFYGIITMIKVEGGTYNTFGGVTVNGTISDYYISQTEITNLQWKCVMGENHVGIGKTGTDRFMGSLPVVNVSYNEIATAGTGFLAKLNAQLAGQTDGMTFKLPTEAQWEYAARGGKNHETYTYAGTNELSYAGWTAGNSNNTIQAVGTRVPNSLGIYDMTGNVWEMCRDLYQASIPTTQNNYVSTSGSGRVRRGAGYSTESEAKLQLSYRNHSNGDDEQQDWDGFRIVLE